MMDMEVRILFVLVVFTQWGWIYPITTSISGEISDDVTFIHKTFLVPPSMRAIIRYHVYYHKSSWIKWRFLPMIGIYTTPDHINIRRQCTEIHYGQVKNRNLHVRLRYDVCRNGPSDIIHCTDRITPEKVLFFNWTSM